MKTPITEETLTAHIAHRIFNSDERDKVWVREVGESHIVSEEIPVQYRDSEEAILKFLEELEMEGFEIINA